MKEYKRLTDKNRDWFEFTEITDSEIYKRLQELEDKIENGTLIELPALEDNMSYGVIEGAHVNGVIWSKRDFLTKAEKKLKELKGE